MIHALLALAAAAGSGDLPVKPAPIIDNAYVSIFKTHLRPRETAPEMPTGGDRITLILDGGSFALTQGGQAPRTRQLQFGDALFTPAGQALRLSLAPASGADVEVVDVLLKGPPPPHEAPQDGIPAAFPRPGAQKLFENDRLTVWRFAWTRGVAVPLHHHDKSIIMAFRDDGTIQSTDQAGVVSPLPFKRGQVTFSLPGRVHTETLSDPAQAAVFVEFK